MKLQQRWARLTGGRGKRRRSRAVVGSGPLDQMESKCLMTVIFGPNYAPHDGASAVLTESNNQIQAHISLACNAAPVKVYYQSFSGATVYPTTLGGDHNNGKQVAQGVQSAILLPGQCIDLSLPEGLAGIAADGQKTGTQFDLSVDPLNDLCGSQRVGIAAAIAYASSDCTNSGSSTTWGTGTTWNSGTTWGYGW